MELIELTKKLMSFKSITANKEISADCINFIIEYVKSWNINKKIIIKEIENNGFKSVLLSNCDTLNLDVLEIGHIDVVPVNKEEIFEPRIENNLLYGRGGADMKGFVAVGLETIKYVVENDLKMKYGFLIVSDEEIGGTNCAKYWAETLKLNAKIILDPDTGKKLNTIIYKSKGAVFVKLISKGESAHGSRPWLGIDATDNLINSINNLREVFPAYSKTNEPTDKWIETMHVGIISGGKATNAITDYAEAKLDIRFTEKYNIDTLLSTIRSKLVNGVEAILEDSGKVVFSEINNKYLQLYNNILEKYTGEKTNFDFATGACDSRYFSNKDTTIIANQADCGELHADGEWLNIEKLKNFFEIRKEFLKILPNNL